MGKYPFADLLNALACNHLYLQPIPLDGADAREVCENEDLGQETSENQIIAIRISLCADPECNQRVGAFRAECEVFDPIHFFIHEIGRAHV